MAQDVTAAGRTFQGNRVRTQEKAKINKVKTKLSIKNKNSLF